MRTALLSIGEIGAQEVGRWRELAARAVESNPFFEPEFVLPAASGLGVEPQLLIATDSAGAWAGAMPLVHARGWHRLPVRVNSAWRHMYSFFGAPLIGAGEEAAVLEAWAGDPRPVRPILGLDLIDADGPVRSALDGLASDGDARLILYDEHERGALRRRDGVLDLGLSAKRRHEQRRLERRLAETAGGEAVVRDRGDSAEAVDDFLALELAGWKGREGTALASSSAHAEFFRQACAGFRRLGRLRLLSLEAGGRTAAMHCSIVADDAVFTFKMAYDEELAAFSPGLQVERALVDGVQDDTRIELIDSCSEAHNEAEKRVWPDRRRIASFAIARPTWSGALPAAMVRASAKTRKTIRRAP